MKIFLLLCSFFLLSLLSNAQNKEITKAMNNNTKQGDFRFASSERGIDLDDFNRFFENNNNYVLIQKNQETVFKFGEKKTLVSSFTFLTRPEYESFQEKQIYSKVINSTSDEPYLTYLRLYPNGEYTSVVKNQYNNLIKKRDEESLYNEVLNTRDYDKYLNKYPYGIYTSTINSKKQQYYQSIENDRIEKERQQKLALEKERIRKEQEAIALIETEKRLERERVERSNKLVIIEKNSNRALWKLGNKICLEYNGDIICGTINQWNEDKSLAQIKIVTSPGGTYEGESLSKNNLIWVSSSGKGWHLCLDDEIQKSLANDKSEKKTEPIFVPKTESYCSACGGRGSCLECNGRGGRVCDYHDTNGDGDCTTCDNTNWIRCSYCYGKGTCRSCGGTGR
jgi:hypothetical protein